MGQIKAAIGAAAVAALLAGCGSAKATAPLGLTPITAPSAAVVKSWPAKWCTLTMGMTKAQLHAVMGAPTNPATDGTSESWDGYEWQFNAFFGVDGTVRQLDINDYRLTPTEKASLQCATTRTAIS